MSCANNHRLFDSFVKPFPHHSAIKLKFGHSKGIREYGQRKE